MIPKLFAPESYYRLSEEDKAAICNGMGSANSILSPIIPNTMYLLDVEECGNIHDFMYYIGKTLEDKKEADRVFLNNMLRVIDAKGGWLVWFRRSRARKYYLAVKYFGGPAFWDGKN